MIEGCEDWCIYYREGNKRRVAFAMMLFVAMMGCLAFTCMIIDQVQDPKLGELQYCLQNTWAKKINGQEDILDASDSISICNSTIVLNYSVEQFEGLLRGSYMALAVTGGLLTAATPPALFGLWKRRYWALLLVWTVADVLFFIALVGSAAALSQFIFPALLPMLIGMAVISAVMAGMPVCILIRKKADRPQQSAEGVELISIRRERDPLDREQAADNVGDAGAADGP